MWYRYLLIVLLIAQFGLSGAAAEASVLSPSVSRIGYPDFTHHGVQRIYTVTLSNSGANSINVSAIQGVKTTLMLANWLAVNPTSLVVPIGTPGTATFDITLNLGGVINVPGTAVNLSGLVYLKTDAPFPDDSIAIAIDRFLVSDTVAVQKWDTVSTSCTRLMISNNGDMGRNGYGHVGLD